MYQSDQECKLCGRLLSVEEAGKGDTCTFCIIKAMDRSPIMARARELIQVARDHGYTPGTVPWETPCYSLWASADKALCNANLGIFGDARTYLKDAEDEYVRLQRGLVKLVGKGPQEPR